MKRKHNRPLHHHHNDLLHYEQIMAIHHWFPYSVFCD
jgi:hypothetical protein